MTALRNLLSRVVSRLSLVRGRYAAEPLEFVSSLSLIMVGLWLLYITATGRPALSYSFMAELAPLQLWGVVFILSGVLTRVGLYYRQRDLRQSAMLIIMTCRLFLLLAVYHGTNGNSNLIPEQLSWLFVSGWAYLRAVNSPRSE